MRFEKLNTILWDVRGILYNPIRKRLILIAEKFLKSIEIPLELKNIYLTGSLCSYEWTSESDLDLHIIVSPKKDCITKSISDDYFDVKSKLYNKEHNIFIKGFPVEVNIKDREDLLKDKAVFDLVSNEWVKKPKIGDRHLNSEEVVKKAKIFQDIIDNAVNNEKEIEELKKIRNDIKKLRSDGLKTGGEFSIGNLAFKRLRHSGYIKKLYDYKAKIVDKKLSLESFKSFIGLNCI